MLNKLKTVNLLCAFSLLTLASGCTTFYNSATQRTETLLIDTKAEVALGADMDQQVKKELKIVDDPKLQKRLNDIGTKVASVSDRKDLEYHFEIVKDDTFNAFAVPGGYVYVHSGLINAADDDELAAVLGHELGHIAARHSVKRLQANLGYTILMNVALGAAGGKQAALLQAVDITFSLVSLGYSRQDEFLADKLAVKYTRLSGYNPYGMVSFFKKLQKEKEKKPNIELVFLSSHPPLKDRIERVEKEINLTQ